MTHVLLDDGSDLAAEIGVAHVAHTLRFEDSIGERIYVGRRRLHEPAVHIRRETETQADAEVVEKLSDLGLEVASVVHEDQHAAYRELPSRRSECDHLPMVMEPVPDCDDLIWLFESEPTYRYAENEPATGREYSWREFWPYTSVTFRTTRVGYRIMMDIEPGYEVVRLRLHAENDGAEILDLSIVGAQTVGVERAGGRELLRVDFPDGAPAATLWLRMKPDVAVFWSYDAHTG